MSLFPSTCAYLHLLVEIFPIYPVGQPVDLLKLTRQVSTQLPDVAGSAGSYTANVNFVFSSFYKVSLSSTRPYSHFGSRFPYMQ